MVQQPKKLVDSIQNELSIYEGYLKKVANAVVQQEISDYPIFIVHQSEELAMGKPVVLSNIMNTKWSVNASVLEEFVRKKVIVRDKLEAFTKVYKDPLKFMCLFIITDTENAGFVFYPYKSEN